LLKLYLRELPTTIMTKEFQPRFIEIACKYKLSFSKKKKKKKKKNKNNNNKKNNNNNNNKNNNNNNNKE